MWKYILIIAFLLFAIREINLMNESLYIAPESHEIVAEDRSLVGKVVQIVAQKIEHAQSPQASQEGTQKPALRTESRHARTDEPKAQQRLPDLSRIEKEREANRSKAADTIEASKTLQELERKLQLQKTQKRKNAPAARTIPAPAPKPQRSEKATRKPKPTPPTPYPDHFKSAEERVREILRQMHPQR